MHRNAFVIVICLFLAVRSFPIEGNDASLNPIDHLTELPDDLFNKIISESVWRSSENLGHPNKRFQRRYEDLHVEYLQRVFRLPDDLDDLLYHYPNLSSGVYSALLKNTALGHHLDYNAAVKLAVTNGSPNSFKALLKFAHLNGNKIEVVDQLHLHDAKRWSDVVKKVCMVLEDDEKLLAMREVIGISLEAAEICVMVMKNTPFLASGYQELALYAAKKGRPKMMRFYLNQIYETGYVVFLHRTINEMVTWAIRKNRFELVKELIDDYGTDMEPFKDDESFYEPCLDEDHFMLLFAEIPSLKENISIWDELARCGLEYLIDPPSRSILEMISRIYFLM